MCAPQAVAGLGPRRPRCAYGLVVVSAVTVSVTMLVVVAVVNVLVVMMGMVMVVVGFAAGVAPKEQREPEPRDDEARPQSDPGIETLRDDVPRGVDGRGPQEIDARRVRGRDDEAEEHRVPGG